MTNLEFVEAVDNDTSFEENYGRKSMSFLRK